MTYQEFKAAMKEKGFKFLNLGSSCVVFKRFDDPMMFCPSETDVADYDAVLASADNDLAECRKATPCPQKPAQ